MKVLLLLLWFISYSSVYTGYFQYGKYKFTSYEECKKQCEYLNKIEPVFYHQPMHDEELAKRILRFQVVEK